MKDNQKLWYQSDRFIIYSEFETVCLVDYKYNSLETTIGDFYGNVFDISVSKDEQFCVMCGVGIIVYFLKEPYANYMYDTANPKQWEEFYRENDLIWFEEIKTISTNYIEVVTEFNEIVRLEI